LHLSHFWLTFADVSPAPSVAVTKHKTPRDCVVCHSRTEICCMRLICGRVSAYHLGHLNGSGGQDGGVVMDPCDTPAALAHSARVDTPGNFAVSDFLPGAVPPCCF
jgi:hypothetical protein